MYTLYYARENFILYMCCHRLPVTEKLNFKTKYWTPIQEKKPDTVDIYLGDGSSVINPPLISVSFFYYQ